MDATQNPASAAVDPEDTEDDALLRRASDDELVRLTNVSG